MSAPAAGRKKPANCFVTFSVKKPSYLSVERLFR